MLEAFDEALLTNFTEDTQSQSIFRLPWARACPVPSSLLLFTSSRAVSAHNGVDGPAGGRPAARSTSAVASSTRSSRHDQLEAMALADILVVMNGGRVEQIGNPLDIYQKPATSFVASFIGAHESGAAACRRNQSAIRE
jgi:hypothetical protein